MSVRRTVLPSGLRIVTEEVPSVRSAAIGIWVNVGSRDETPAVAGASHFLEHLLFKGTTRRTALEISATIEAVGGEMNAFTSKEYTCFYARVIDTDLPMAIDVVSDLITSSIVSALDVDAERKVVLEEIAMRDDDPSDLVHDLYAETYYGDTQLGRPILGTVKSIKEMTRNSVFNYYKKKYLPQDLVVAVAGNIKHKRVVAMVEEALSRDNFLDVKGAPQIRPNTPVKTKPVESVGLLTRKTEQAHMFYGMEGVARSDDRRFAMGVLASALGGGMSSRLFQEIREKRGLAYSVYSFNQGYSDAATFGLYAGCSPAKAKEVTELMIAELQKVAESGITMDELELAKGNISGSLALKFETNQARMSRLASAEIVAGEFMDLDETIARFDGVALPEVQSLAKHLIQLPRSIVAVGDVTEDMFEGFVR